MRLPWKSALSLAVALTAIIVLSGPASANHTGIVQTAGQTVTDNNLVLDVDHYEGYTFVLASGDSIVYAIQVITPSSTNIDVFFFTSAGLAAYQNDPPQTSQAVVSLTNRDQFGGTFGAASGSITVIIDNVNGTGAMPTGPVTVQVGMTTQGAPPPDFFTGIIAAGLILCVGVIAVIVIVIFLIIYLITRGSRPPMPPGPPLYPPPQQPWPPQPPQQPPGQYPP